MSRPKLIERPRKLTINLPESLATRLELVLRSSARDTMPYGAWQKFFVERSEEYLAKLANPEAETRKVERLQEAVRAAKDMESRLQFPDTTGS